jgi:hypothetical protein
MCGEKKNFGEKCDIYILSQAGTSHKSLLILSRTVQNMRSLSKISEVARHFTYNCEVCVIQTKSEQIIGLGFLNLRMTENCTWK